MAIKAMQNNPLWDKQVERNMEKAKEVLAALPDLCPDLETCEKIPAGKFETSIYVWMKSWSTDGWGHFKETPRSLKPRTSNTIRYEDDIPAPTAAEILSDLKAMDGIWCPGVHSSASRSRSMWMAQCRTVNIQKQHRCAGSWRKAVGRTPTEALMKLWLDVNGIEEQLGSTGRD